MIENINLYIGMAIAGIFTGLGSAIGNYLAQKHAIEKIEKIKQRLIKSKK
jgi:hypothetical protein